MLAGEYGAAIPIYEKLVKEEPRAGNWNSYGTALLCAGDAAGAESAFLHVREFPHPNGFVSRAVGASLWLQGRPEDACADWIQEIGRLMSTILKTYAAEGLFLTSLLWWASQRLVMPEMWDALQPQLNAILRLRSQQEEWGMAITQFIRGSVTPDRLLQHAAGTDDLDISKLERSALRRVSQAYFYIAGKQSHNSPEWQASLKQTVLYAMKQASTTAEYHIAKYELAHAG